jgi:hypothetical protein
VGKTPVARKLTRDEAGSLVRLVIARYNMRYGKPINSTILAQLLFLALYTTRRGNTLALLRRPRARFPVLFRLLNAPYLPIGRLLGRVGVGDVVWVGDGYSIRDPARAFWGSYNALVQGGLKDLADYTVRVVDEYGGYSEEYLVELSTRVLGLSPFIRAMAFNMSLDAYIEARRVLRKVFEGNEYVDEEELYPELFKRA